MASYYNNSINIIHSHNTIVKLWRHTIVLQAHTFVQKFRTRHCKMIFKAKITKFYLLKLMVAAWHPERFKWHCLRFTSNYSIRDLIVSYHSMTSTTISTGLAIVSYRTTTQTTSYAALQRSSCNFGYHLCSVSSYWHELFIHITMIQTGGGCGTKQMIFLNPGILASLHKRATVFPKVLCPTGVLQYQQSSLGLTR